MCLSPSFISSQTYFISPVPFLCFCCWNILKQVPDIIPFTSKHFSMHPKRNIQNTFLHNHNAIITSNTIQNNSLISFNYQAILKFPLLYKNTLSVISVQNQDQTRSLLFGYVSCVSYKSFKSYVSLNLEQSPTLLFFLSLTG